MPWRKVPLAVLGVFVAVCAGYATLRVCDAIGLDPTIGAWLAIVAFIGVITLLGRLPTGS